MQNKTKKTIFIWEIETNNNKTFNRWNLCNFFFALLKFIIYQQWRKKQLCSFFLSRLNGEQRRRSHNIFTVIKRTRFEFMRMAVPVKGENYRKVVLTRRMNKPRLWYARRIYTYVAFSMLLFMHMQVIMLSKGAARNKAPQGNAARQTIRQPFLTATYFYSVSIYERLNHVYFMKFSTVFSFDLTSMPSNWKDFTISDLATIFTHIKKIPKKCVSMNLRYLKII